MRDNYYSSYIGETDKLLPEICRLGEKRLSQSSQDLTIHKVYKYRWQFAHEISFARFFDHE